MEGKILAKDFAEFDKIKQGLDDVIKRLTSLADVSGRFKTDKQALDVIKERTRLEQSGLFYLKEENRLRKSLQTTLAKQAASNTTLNKELVKSRFETQQLNRINKEYAVLSSRLSTEYQKQSTRLTQLRRRFKDIALTQGLASKEARRLAKEVNVLDKRLKAVDGAAGQFGRVVGNYPKSIGLAVTSLRSLAGAFGFTSALFIFVDLLRSAADITVRFDQSQADLAAILGKSREEISALTVQAKELGATTAFSATQVAELQLELSKLGFTEEQILAAARGVENLAIATGVEAPRAAKLAGASIRGFALDAEEANRVAATLAVSTTKSANSFETLEVALPKVSAIAKSFGFTIEDTVALLGGLQNAGFEASIAGTSLRQIFLQLADSNGALAQRLGGNAANFDELIDQFVALDKEGIDLSEAFELTNARSVAAFKTFLQGAEDLRTLRNQITDVEDGLTNIAETKLDSIQGETTLLKSAWEGLVLAIEDGDNATSDFVKDSLSFFREELGNATFAIENNIGFLDRYKLGLNSLFGIFDESVKKLKEDTEARVENARAIQAQVDNFIKLNGTLGPLAEGQKDATNNFSIFTEGIRDTKDEIQTTAQSVGDFRARISELNKDLEGATNRDEATRIQNLIDKYKQQLEAILGVTGSRDKEAEAVKGSIKFYQNLISELSKQRDGFATTSDEIKIYNDRIEAAKFAIDALNDELNQLQPTSLNLLETGIDQDDELQALADRLRLKAILEQQEVDQAKENSEKLKGIAQETYFAITDIVNNAFDGRIQRIEDEINRSNDYYANLLNNENLSEQDRSAIEAEREAKERQLQSKQRKEQRKQAIFNKALAVAEIAINTAQAISKVAAQTGVGSPLIIPGFIALGALQTAAVLSTPIPNFFKGTQFAPEGLAYTQEKGRELITDKQGNIKSLGSDSGSELTYLSKGDKVYTAQETQELLKPVSNKEILNNIALDNENRQSVLVNNRTNTKAMEQKLDSVNINLKKLAKRPVYANVKLPRNISRNG